MAMELGVMSGKYVGNGTTQNILFSTNWNNLTITSGDRKYIMTYYKNNGGQTIGLGAIGSGGTFRQVTVTTGGISELTDGFSVGSHTSINELSTEYFWSVS